MYIYIYIFFIFFKEYIHTLKVHRDFQKGKFHGGISVVKKCAHQGFCGNVSVLTITRLAFNNKKKVMVYENGTV